MKYKPTEIVICWNCKSYYIVTIIVKIEDVNSYSDACQFSSFLFASIALRQYCIKIDAGSVGFG
jgi:hypothetical protein